MQTLDERWQKTPYRDHQCPTCWSSSLGWWLTGMLVSWKINKNIQQSTFLVAMKLSHVTRACYNNWLQQDTYLLLFYFVNSDTAWCISIANDRKKITISQKSTSSEKKIIVITFPEISNILSGNVDKMSKIFDLFNLCLAIAISIRHITRNWPSQLAKPGASWVLTPCFSQQDSREYFLLSRIWLLCSQTTLRVSPASDPNIFIQLHYQYNFQQLII